MTARVVAHYLGAFRCGEPACALCRAPGVWVAWLCAGRVLATGLCEAHASKVPARTLSAPNLLADRPRRLHVPRGLLRRLTRAQQHGGAA